MENFIRRKTRMREAAREKAKDYLRNITEDYDLIIDAVAEMLWEDFQVKSEASTNMAKHLIGPIWNDIVAEVNIENQETEDFYRSREMDLADARGGRW